MKKKKAIRVFLADDHAVVRDGLRLILESKEDITVVGEATDGRQAVREVRKLCPDVVIMDIAMPELNGIEATSRISKTCPLTNIIIFTIYDSNEYIVKALKAGAKGYILKESAGEELVRAIRRVHSGDNYLSQEISQDVIQIKKELQNIF